jgi:pyrimidine deaminase RibD-like protein
LDDELERKIVNYADKAYAAAFHDIDQKAMVEIANVKEQLASKGLASSSVMVRQMARVHGERVNALVQAKADALLDAYELYGAEFDGSILEQAVELRSKVIAEINDNPLFVPPNGTSQLFLSFLTANTAAIINSISCQLEQRKVMPKFKKTESHANNVDEDRRFALMAIEEARKSVAEDGRPHPMVGAVVVKDGKVLSTAHRGELPGNHAEYVALEKKLSDEAVAGATVYTTLEPCTTRNHRKVPCALRLIERRVARVVMGMLDPDVRITGRGQRELRKAGIATDFFPSDLMAEVEDLNRDFTRFCEQNVRTEVGPANMELWKEVAGLRTEFAEFKENSETREKIRAEFEHFPVSFSFGQGSPGNYSGDFKNDSKYTVSVETIRILRGDVDHESPLTGASKPRATDDWTVESGKSKTLFWEPQGDPISMLRTVARSPDANFPNGVVIPMVFEFMLNVDGRRFPNRVTRQVSIQGSQIFPWGP